MIMYNMNYLNRKKKIQQIIKKKNEQIKKHNEQIKKHNENTIKINQYNKININFEL